MVACQDANAPDAGLTPPTVSTFAGSPRSPIADQYIVVFENDVDDVEGRAKGLVAAHGGKLNSTYRSALKGFSAQMSATAAAALENNPAVAFVEADQKFVLAGTQTNVAWGLDRIDQAQLPMNGTYNYSSTGAGVNVYIIDSGIRRTHTEFAGRVVPAFSSIADAYGPDGCHWHGSHVAGIVGGTIYGVAKSATLHSVRAYDCSGIGTSSSILAAIDWVTANHTGPSVALMSISGPSSLAVNAAVQSSINAGITYVAAAGNNTGDDACRYSPAGVTDAITVAAISGTDRQTGYTNVGNCVDLYAPGSQIYSATAESDTAIALFTGTSQAAAFVAGAAALHLEGSPDALPADVAASIISNATVGVVLEVTGGTPNRLLRVGGSGGSEPTVPDNSAPVASFTSSCNKGNCSFDASASRDDSGLADFSWNFGDGVSGSSGVNPKTTHQYTTKGNYTVEVMLTVTDRGGLKSSMRKSLTIRNKGK